MDDLDLALWLADVLSEELGARGRFSDLWGGRRLGTRTGIYSTGDLHDDLLARAAGIAPATPESHYEHP